MTPTAFLEHQLPGRVRLRISSKRGDVAFFESVVKRLAEHPVVDELSANPATGSLLILHSGEAEAIASLAAQHGLFQVLRRRPAPDRPGRRATGSEGIGAAGINPLNAAAVGLSGLAFYQVTQGQALGSAAENFWNAYGAYRILNNPWLTFGFAGFGLYQLTKGELLGSASALLFYALLTQHIAKVENSEADG